MPELPAVETVRRGLLPVMEGAVFQRVTANRPDLRFPLPHEAAFWASQIPDPKIQTRQLLGVLHPWWKNDPDAADRWVSTAQLSATVREEVDAARAQSRNRASPAASTESHEGT